MDCIRASVGVVLFTGLIGFVLFCVYQLGYINGDQASYERRKRERAKDA